MKLSAKTAYGCLAMLQLAEDHAADQPAPLRSLSARQGIPESFLVQILQDLRRAGLVTSIRGSGGGYRLSRMPDAVTLAEVIAAIEGQDPPGAAAVAAKPTPLSGVLSSVCSELRELQQERLTGLSLSELVDRAATAPIVEPMWYI